MADTRDVERSNLVNAAAAGVAAEWQHRLLTRFLWLTTALGGFLVVRDLASGQRPVYAGLALLIGLTGFLILRAYRRLSTLVAGTLFGMGATLLGLTALDGESAAVPSFCFAILPGMMATLLQGPKLGGMISALTLATLLGVEIVFPVASLKDAYRFVNEAAMLVLGYLTAWALDRGFRAYQRVVEAQAAGLAQINSARVAMARALFDELGPLLASLRDRLTDGAPSAGANAATDDLVKCLREARTLGQGGEHDVAPYHLEGIRRATAIRLLLVLLAGQTVLVLMGTLGGFESPHSLWGGLTYASIVASGLLLALLAGLRYRPATFTPGRIGLVLVSTGAVAMLMGFASWGADATSPTLVLVPTLVIVASVLNGWAVLTAAFFLGAAILAYAALGAPIDRVSGYLLANLVVLQIILGLVAVSTLRLRQRFLGHLRDQAQDLSEALRLRRRLAGTLFHDVSNQVMALQGELQLGEEDGTPVATVFARSRALCNRIEGLVLASKAFLLDEAGVDTRLLKALAVEDLFGDMETLFQARLRAKDQTLKVASPPGLRVLGLPEIVTESVLGNLVNNAIKFSPPGSVIELRAEARGAQVALLVRDTGPGIGMDVLQELGKEGPVRSSAGSLGETGQGLGLGLVREHLRRQGGILELHSRAEGGTEALVLLPAA